MSFINSLLNFCVVAAIVGSLAFYVVSPKPPKPAPNDQKFLAEIQRPGTVLVKFGAPRCPPCRMIEAELDSLSASMGGQVSVVKIDVDQNHALAAHYGISGIPHLILFQNGKQVSEVRGYRSRDQLKSWIAKSR